MGKTSRLLIIVAIIVAYKRRRTLKLDIMKLMINIVALLVKSFRLKLPTRSINGMKILESDFKQGYDTPTAQHIAISKILSLDKSIPTLKSFRFLMENTPAFSIPEDLNFDLKKKKTGSSKSEQITYYEVRSHHVSKKNHVLFYLHGGGYVSGSVKAYLGVIARLSSSTGLTVIAPEYGLSPEYTQSQQIQQIRQVFFEVRSNHEVIVIGDSAGGGLSLGLLQSLTKLEPKPKAAVLISPYIDLKSTGESYKVNEKTDYLISKAHTDLFLKHSDTSFMNESFENLKEYKSLEVYITASEEERLYSDSVFLVEKLNSLNNVVVFFESAKYGIHDYPLISNIVREYQPSYDRICSFIRSSWEFKPSGSR